MLRREEGQSLVLYALFLAGILGMASLAIDTGNLYMVRTSFQRAADAAAMAGASGLVVSQDEATSRATAYANLNLSTQPTLNGTPTVTFPTANSVRVTITDPAVSLFFGGIVGFSTAPVTASATAGLEDVSSVNGDVVPLAIYCYNATGCDGVLAVGQTYTSRRYCGNFFRNGPGGSACGDSVAPGEVFIQGVTITRDSNSNAVFREEVYRGHSGIVSMNDHVGALPGNRNGWRSGMTDRLAEGRNQMTVAVIRPIGAGLTMEVVALMKVRVTGFYIQGNGDTTSFEIIREVVSSMDFGPGDDIDSIAGVRLLE